MANESTCHMTNEKRLIDANALKDALRTNDGAKALGHSFYKLFAVDEIIDQMPTVDAVEVVRCKDCKHRGSNLCPMETVELYPWFGTKDEAFCFYGERRTE